MLDRESNVNAVVSKTKKTAAAAAAAAATHTTKRQAAAANTTSTAQSLTSPSSATAPTPQNAPLKPHELFLEVLDLILSSLVVAPCVIAYWRGTWELMGVLIFPTNQPLSALVSFLIGGIGHVFFTLTQGMFKNNVHPDKRRLTYYVVSRLYTALFAIVCVNMWRGAWQICDWLTSIDSIVIIAIVTLVAILFLIATRTVRNLGAAPYTVVMDHKSDYFDVETMFKIPDMHHRPGLYLLDTLFSVFVIGTLVVIAWRGLWGIMDLTFYPDDKPTSSWGSLIMGYITVFITFVIQPCIRCICKRIDGIIRLIICDIFYFLMFFGAVNSWRGIWNLLDLYLYPDNPIMSYWITHVIPFLILAALKCSNSILVRGIYIDAEGDANECVAVPINYVKLHFERERSKRLYLCPQPQDHLHHAHKQQQHHQQQQPHQQQQQQQLLFYKNGGTTQTGSGDGDMLSAFQQHHQQQVQQQQHEQTIPLIEKGDGCCSSSGKDVTQIV